MKNKYVLLVSFLTIFAFEVEASLKIDFSVLAGRVTDFAGDLGEAAGVVTDTAAMGKEVLQKGSKAKVLFEKAKMIGKEIGSKVTNAVETFKSVLPGYNDDEQAHVYEDQLAQATQDLENTPNELKIKGQEYDIQIADRQKALYNQALGKHQAAQENVSTLQQMLSEATDSGARAKIQSVLNDNMSEIEKYASEMKDLKSAGSKILKSDAIFQELSKGKDLVNGKLNNIFDNAKSRFGNLSLDSVNNMLSKSPEQKSTEYNEIIKENFLLADESENAENVSRVKKHRMDEMVDSMAKSFVAAVKFKNSYDAKVDEIFRNQDNAIMSEQQLSKIGMMTEVKINETKLLHEYNKLLISNMRLKTSLNMKNQDYRLKNYDKNPAELNFDNYVFTEKDVDSTKESSFLDNVRAK